MIAVSEFTKREVVELLGTCAGEGARDPERGRGSRSRRTARAPRATTCSRSGRSSRARTLPRAARRRSALASSCGSSAREGWGGVKVDGWLGRVSDEELAALYRGARCLVYPSLYEGFGHPGARGDGVRDAGRHERAAARPRRSRGGAAVLVDPLDPASIAAGIEEALAPPRRAARRRASSARRRSPGSASRAETRAVYEEAAA